HIGLNQLAKADDAGQALGYRHLLPFFLLLSQAGYFYFNCFFSIRHQGGDFLSCCRINYFHGLASLTWFKKTSSKRCLSSNCSLRLSENSGCHCTAITFPSSAPVQPMASMMPSSGHTAHTSSPR